MEITRCLREEHDLILRVLDALESTLRETDGSARVFPGVFQPFLAFFEGFIEQCHHAKEEAALFPAIERSGIPTEGGPIGAMLHEHRLAGEYIRTIADKLDRAERGDAEAAELVLKTFHELLDLLRRHIDKDSHCVLGMAERVVSGTEREAVLRGYHEVEADSHYQETACRCRRLADELIAAHTQRSSSTSST